MIVLWPVYVGTALRDDEFYSLSSKEVPQSFVTYQADL